MVSALEVLDVPSDAVAAAAPLDGSAAAPVTSAACSELRPIVPAAGAELDDAAEGVVEGDAGEERPRLAPATGSFLQRPGDATDGR